MSAENEALLRRWFDEVWNKGREVAIDEMMAGHAVVHGLGTADMHGIAGFKPFYNSFRSAFPDIRISIDAVISQGDIVAARWSGSGTHRGADLGVPATGKVVQLNGMTFARMQNGKIVEGWNSFDQLGMLQQIGAVPEPTAT
jgi:steroid delta-isomerase-like uncharacterized protein